MKEVEHERMIWGGGYRLTRVAHNGTMRIARWDGHGQTKMARSVADLSVEIPAEAFAQLVVFAVRARLPRLLEDRCGDCGAREFARLMARGSVVKQMVK